MLPSPTETNRKENNKAMKKINRIKVCLVAFAAVAAFSGCASSGADGTPCQTQSPACAAQNLKTQKKMTKDMFYKNGKFDQEAAKQAYFDTMKKLGYPISDNLRENMWVTDFDLGDFPNVGMAGIFWAHENKHGVFGHEIILLPNQMLIEHAHVAQDGLPAKNECWQARAGTTYCFGETGEMDDTQLPEVKVPESQKNFITVHKVTKADSKKGNVVWLSRIGSFHYQIAGPEGAVVTEYGSYHNTPGNRYTNPKVGF